MKSTIVIPHKDRLDHLRWCLGALKRQVTQHTFDVIVVDDGSDLLPEDALTADDMPAAIRFINQHNRGAASARNRGWQASDSEIIIFLDCDQIVFPRFIDRCLAPFKAAKTPFMQLGTRRHLPYGHKVDLETLNTAPSYPDERLRFFRATSFNLANIEIAWHLGFSHNMAVRRHDLLAHGGFDEAFTGWGFEDCELTYRLQRNGVPPILNPLVEACHQSHSARMSPEKYDRWLKNLRYFMDKHPTPEVASQTKLIKVCNPALPKRMKWTEGLTEMEEGLRLSEGRATPVPPTKEAFCETLDDLHSLAKEPDCAQTRALVSPSKVRLFVAAQLDPALKEIRLFWANGQDRPVSEAI